VYDPRVIQTREAEQMRWFLFLLLAMSSGLCAADEYSDRLAAARQLVELLHVGDAHVQANAGCIPDKVTAAREAKIFYERQPDKFGGITPQSAYWPEYEKLYYNYLVEYCAAAEPQTVVPHYAEAFAQTASLSDLKGAIAFFSSPEGRSFQKASMEAGVKFAVAFHSAHEAVAKSAENNYLNGMRELVARSKADPQ
jgi:hypothetical protein